jgi:ABC-type sugar transport system substrate-binding protein
MKATAYLIRLLTICSLGLLLAGCGDKADSTKAPAGAGRLFGVSFQTMNNPFFVDLNAGLQKTIEGHGDRLTTLDAQFNSLKQKNDISDLIQRRCKPASVICSSSLLLHPSGVRRSEGERSEPSAGALDMAMS